MLNSCPLSASAFPGLLFFFSFNLYHFAPLISQTTAGNQQRIAKWKVWPEGEDWNSKNPTAWSSPNEGSFLELWNVAAFCIHLALFCKANFPPKLQTIGVNSLSLIPTRFHRAHSSRGNIPVKRTGLANSDGVYLTEERSRALSSIDVKFIIGNHIYRMQMDFTNLNCPYLWDLVNLKSKEKG